MNDKGSDISIIINLRKTLRISQYKLSIITGIPRTRISLAECGYISLDPEEINKIRQTIITNTSNMLKATSTEIKSMAKGK